MERLTLAPRSDWVKKVEELGLIYHHTANNVYWDESAYYAFTSRDIDKLEAATNELQRLCLEAGQHIIDKKRYAELGIPASAVPMIEWSWNAEPPAIYGRFDLAYDGVGPPKMLEYNADTPTALLEASVVQWYWMKEQFPQADQFNSIHERLVAKWKELRDYLTGTPLYFTHVDDQMGEDLMTATYLRDTANEAGLATAGLLIADLGWDRDRKIFVDQASAPVTSLFKLYPWEWLVHEQFAPQMLSTYTQMQWIEPIWKMLFSNKGILAILWELFPGHPNLLKAHLGEPDGMAEFVKKPLLSREGANVTRVTTAGQLSTSGDYGEEGYVYQAIAPIPNCGGHYPVLGCWVVDGQAAGMGIRESDGLITDNLSRFVPHLFR